MPTFDDPVADADEVREATRGLAPATRSIDEPTSICTALGSISYAPTSPTQVHHQIGQPVRCADHESGVSL